MAWAPTTVKEVCDAVREATSVLPHGSRTKRPLGLAGDHVQPLDMRQLTGVTEYEPGEFTFSAYAGTPVSDIEAMLHEHGQYLPFDPPLTDPSDDVEQSDEPAGGAAGGATLGGTVAAGLSGSRQFRYGGVRDFIIGVRFVDGSGRLIRGGGKVVKNAAGFDLPKLMVGSAGRLGVMTELTFKVFPRPEASRTLRATCENLDDALARLADLARRPLELDAIDIEPPATLILRVSGNAASLPTHAQRVAEATGRPCDLLDADADAAYWAAQRRFAWAARRDLLIKAPLSLPDIAPLEQRLAAADVPRRYAVAGNVAWIAWPRERPLADLDLGDRQGWIVRGDLPENTSPRLNAAASLDAPFANAIKTALDPHNRFPPIV